MFIEAYRRDSGSHTSNQPTTFNRLEMKRPNEALATANLKDDKKPSIDDYARRSVGDVDPNIASPSSARGIGKNGGDSSIDCECAVGGSPRVVTEGDVSGDGTDRSIISDGEIQDSSSTRDNTINNGDILGSRFANVGPIRGREVGSPSPNDNIVSKVIVGKRGDRSTFGEQVKDGDIQAFTFSGGNGELEGKRESGGGHRSDDGDNVINDGDNQDSSFARGESGNDYDGTDSKHDEDNGSHSSSHSISKGGDAFANSTSSGGGHAIANSSNSKGGLAIANSTSSNGGSSIANSISSNDGNSIANSTSTDGGNSIANSISDGGNSTANGTTSHGGNFTIDSTTGQSSIGDGDNSIVNSNVNGGNSTIVSSGGNSIIDGQVGANNSEGDQGSSGNDSIADGDSGVSTPLWYDPSESADNFHFLACVS